MPAVDSLVPLCRNDYAFACVSIPREKSLDNYRRARFLGTIICIITLRVAQSAARIALYSRRAAIWRERAPAETKVIYGSASIGEASSGETKNWIPIDLCGLQITGTRSLTFRIRFTEMRMKFVFSLSDYVDVIYNDAAEPRITRSKWDVSLINRGHRDQIHQRPENRFDKNRGKQERVSVRVCVCLCVSRRLDLITD